MSIKTELETNAHLMADFGDLTGDEKWTESEIQTSTDASLVAAGADSNLRGFLKGGNRPDLVIVDDIEDDENINTSEQRDKTEGLLNRKIINMLAPGGDVFVIGTLLHNDSLLAKLLKGWKGTKYKAIQDDGTALWPERFSLETLRKIKDGDGEKVGIGSLAFEQEFQNNPIDPATQIVKSEWIRYYEPKDIEFEELLIASALDPSVGRTTHSDYSAIVTVARSNGNYYVLDCDMKRRSVDEQVQAVVNHFEKWHLRRITGRRQYVSFGIESNGFQYGIKTQVDRLALIEGLNVPTVEVKNYKDKISRIQSISPLIEQGRVMFLHGQQELVGQLTAFPKGAYDDGPDALEMAINLLGRAGTLEHRSSGVRRDYMALGGF